MSGISCIFALSDCDTYSSRFQAIMWRQPLLFRNFLLVLVAHVSPIAAPPPPSAGGHGNHHQSSRFHPQTPQVHNNKFQEGFSVFPSPGHQDGGSLSSLQVSILPDSHSQAHFRSPPHPSNQLPSFHPVSTERPQQSQPSPVSTPGPVYGPPSTGHPSGGYPDDPSGSSSNNDNQNTRKCNHGETGVQERYKTSCRNVKVPENGPTRWKFVCDVDVEKITVCNQHILWVQTGEDEKQIIDVEIPNYRIEDLIEARSNNTPGENILLNLLLKSPDLHTNARKEENHSPDGVGPTVNIEYEPLGAKRVHYPDDKGFIPVRGPLQERKSNDLRHQRHIPSDIETRVQDQVVKDEDSEGSSSSHSYFPLLEDGLPQLNAPSFWHS